MIGPLKHGATAFKFFIRYLELKQVTIQIDGNGIPVLDKGKRTAFPCFWGDMSDAGSAGGAGEAPSVIIATDLCRPIPTSIAAGIDSSRIPGPPFGPS